MGLFKDKKKLEADSMKSYTIFVDVNGPGKISIYEKSS